MSSISPPETCASHANFRFPGEMNPRIRNSSKYLKPTKLSPMSPYAKSTTSMATRALNNTNVAVEPVERPTTLSTFSRASSVAQGTSATVAAQVSAVVLTWKSAWPCPYATSTLGKRQSSQSKSNKYAKIVKAPAVLTGSSKHVRNAAEEES